MVYNAHVNVLNDTAKVHKCITAKLTESIKSQTIQSVLLIVILLFVLGARGCFKV